MSTDLTLTYSGAPAAATDPVIGLEQEAVSSGTLTLGDLQAMLSLVRSGISARAYQPTGCEAAVVAQRVQVELGLLVWPSSLDLPYTLETTIPSWVEVGPGVAVSPERDFDLVIGLTDTVTLPFVADDLQVTWQTPAYNSWGEVVDRPAITVSGITLTLSASVFGVLRVRCRAMGYRHALTVTIPKTDGNGNLVTVDELDLAAGVTWAVSDGTGSAELELALPGCVTSLLESCLDGTTPGTYGRVTEDGESDPVVYYSPCNNGEVIAVRYEQP